MAARAAGQMLGRAGRVRGELVGSVGGESHVN